ncbi:PREDICTED: probable transcriptional regulator SLK2 [Tarenaya hassleriana]|uniref:probable transcriptional regulator SLK2 n=1 Tax=Tarenaya hassleriana TaxID=28532 RepID=UPI00053C69F3|nr:PREDICTED: probable transcriptional regulator SLK2 [Tarenaya hassleriana]XP_010546086.1 PREDICTED: probable transcriptional regulator SLK2 [Tarenaya hassleriana]XP_010546087.1 PREDICTED: probable transcriptional regulator SLK2 [Tarenaya hassleriana]
MAGGPTQSSSSSGIFFQGDGESQGFMNCSLLNSSYGNSANSGPGSGQGYHNLSMVSTGDVNNPMMNSVSTSGPSVGASSLVTDANSGLSGGGPHLQRSTSINNESYMRLPASPMSFSSNNISISGSSIVDGSTVVQQSSHQNPSVQQGGSSATSQNGRSPLSVVPRAPETFFQDPNNLTRVQKKPRLDMKQDDFLQQQVLRQWLQRQDMLQQQHGHNPQFQLLLQQQRLRQQQQQQQQLLLQSLSPLQRVQLQQQQLHQQGMQQQQLPVAARSYENSVCARRLMQYLYHQRQRPSDNSIVYWKKFVAEYYSPRAKKRWCLSLYDNVGHQTLGVFPQAAMDAWQCDICGSKSGRGFEATFEVLPRLSEIKFASGVIDELLYLGVPFERRTPSGIMILEYEKAVQESVYEHFRVVREGHLRIIFSQELKILSWEFCARRHEELLPRRFVGPQVNQLLQVAQKCQSSLSECGSNGVLQQEDLQANGNMVVAAGCHLKRSLELHSLNDLGFSKRYVRCLQISEVVNSMKDLIDFCRDQRVGPIEALNNYPRHTDKLQMQKIPEMEQPTNSRGFPVDRRNNSLNQAMALQKKNPGINIPMSDPAQAAFPFTNYQAMFTRQNTMNSNPNPSPSSSSFQGHSGLLPTSLQNPSTTGQESSINSLSLQANHQQPSINGNQALEQQMIHQLLQQISNRRSSNTGTGQSIMGIGQHPSSGGQIPSSSNSFGATSNNGSSSVAGSNKGLSHQNQNLASSEEGMVPNMSQEFPDNGFFNSDLDDDHNNNNTMSYAWKY